MKPFRIVPPVLLLASLASGVVFTLHQRANDARNSESNPEPRLETCEPTMDIVAAETPAETRKLVVIAPRSKRAASAGHLRVTGSVTGEHGELVPEVALRWLDEQGAGLDTRVESGAYALDGLHPGRWIVSASGSGWRAEQFEVQLEPRTLAQHRDFTLHAASAHRIRLVDHEGRPLTGLDDNASALRTSLTVIATRDAPGETLAPTSALQRSVSEYGLFLNRWDLGRSARELPADCLGILELMHGAPLFVSLVSGNAVLVTQRLAVVPDEIVIPIGVEEIGWRRAGLQVKLLHPDERPPSNVVTLALSNAGAPLGFRNDADARAEHRDAGAGLRYLPNAGPSASLLKSQAAPKAGKLASSGSVMLLEEQALHLRFEFPEGDTQTVQFVLREESVGRPLETLGTSVDEIATGPDGIGETTWPGLGTYALRVVHVGDHAADARDELGARPRRLVAGAAAQDEIVVPLVKTTDLELRPSRHANAVSRWLISTDDGLPCVRVRVGTSAPTRIQLAPGAYTIARLKVGSNVPGQPWPFALGDETLTIDLH